MTKKLIYETDTDSDTEIRLVVAKTEGVEGIGWEFGVSRCKPLYLSIYIKRNHFAAHEKIIQHCKLTIIQKKN